MRIIVLLVTLVFTSLTMANTPFYWNGHWDSQCSKCWPAPQGYNNDRCTSKDCVLQGYYQCQPQYPPLKKSNDPRIVQLIKGGQCTFYSLKKMSTAQITQTVGLPTICRMKMQFWLMVDRFGKPIKEHKHAIDWKMRLMQYIVGLKAKENNPDAQVFMAIMYMSGYGVTADRNKAMKLYLKAAKEGNLTAQFVLGMAYRLGLGVIPSNKKSLYWLSTASKQKVDPDSSIDVRCSQFYLTNK